MLKFRIYKLSAQATGNRVENYILKPYFKSKNQVNYDDGPEELHIYFNSKEEAINYLDGLPHAS